MVKKAAKLTVIDFFCGAGGFSEGFRQQGMKVVMGLDNWKPAVETHNLNHGLNDESYDIASLWGNDSADTMKIDSLPDTDVIIGSPPCVSFSMSNKAGKADKSLGIHLIKTYLRFIAVKKHQKHSILKAWLLENVPNSEKYIENQYTFTDLNLGEWARLNGLKPSSIAIVKSGHILISSDYGAPQSRRRYVCGEVVRTNEFPLPEITDGLQTLGQIKAAMPEPLTTQSAKKWQDPNYPALQLDVEHITDHFYDTGLYKSEWDKARELKLFHPFMGKMSFPENLDKPSRTITATRSGSTRESLIFKSELPRSGHGEYRLPTIREAATLMGYPYTYQFVGSEGTKWKLIGNSVSPQLSFALAGRIFKDLNLAAVDAKEIIFNQLPSEHNGTNLNDFKPKTFEATKQRQKASKFRRVILKERNTTLELMNYHPNGGSIPGDDWYLVLFRGTGQGFRHYILDERILNTVIHNGLADRNFLSIATLVRKLKINPHELQKIYETDMALVDSNNPIVIVDLLREELVRLKDVHNARAAQECYLAEDIPFGWRQRTVASHFAHLSTA